MKTTNLFLLLFVSFFGYSQFSTPEIYGELGFFYEDEFEPRPNIYYKVSGGIQLFSYKFIAPEIDISYYTGSDEEKVFYDFGLANNSAKLSRKMNAVIWGFAPKLFYGDEKLKFVLIPKWNFGKVNALGNFTDSEENALERKTDSKINFWSFSIGIEGEAWENSPNIGLYLTYNGFNAGKALNLLDFESQGFSKSDYNTKAIGLGIRISFNFKKKQPRQP